MGLSWLALPAPCGERRGSGPTWLRGVLSRRIATRSGNQSQHLTEDEANGFHSAKQYPRPWHSDFRKPGQSVMSPPNRPGNGRSPGSARPHRLGVSLITSR